MAPASGAVTVPMSKGGPASALAAPASAVPAPTDGAAATAAATQHQQPPRPAPPPDHLAPAQLVHLTSLADVNRLLHEAVARERSIEEELDARLAMRQDLERRLSSLQRAAQPLLEAAMSDAQRLAAKAGSAAQQADRISGGVRRLDAAASRVSAALELVRRTAERATCVDAAEAAVAAEDLPAGAAAAARFRELDALLSPAAAALGGGGSGRAVFEGLTNSEEHEEDPVDAAAAAELRQRAAQAGAQLEAAAARRLEQAARSRDRPAVLRAAALYPKLGLRERGLARYVAYVREAVGDKARQHYAALSDALEAGSSGSSAKAASRPPGAEFVDALTSALRDFALATEEDEAAVGESFGPGAALALVKGLQLECDAQATRVLARLDEARRLSRMVDEAAAARAAAAQGRAAAGRHGAPGAGAGAPGPEPRRVEAALQEAAVLLQRAAEYEAFMVAKLRTAADRADAAADAADAAELGVVIDAGGGSGSGSEEEEDLEEEDADNDDNDDRGSKQRRRQQHLGSSSSGGRRKGPQEEDDDDEDGDDDGTQRRRGRRRKEDDTGAGSKAAKKRRLLLEARRAARRQQRQREEAAFRSGSFSVSVRELVGRYVSLEEYYLESTVALAIRLDQVSASGAGDGGAGAASANAANASANAAAPAAPPPVGSMVDDAFFVARKSGGRALSCGSAQAACAALGALNDVLANDLRAALAAKLSSVGGGGGYGGHRDAAAPAGAAAARAIAAAAARAAAEGRADLLFQSGGAATDPEATHAPAAALAACAAVNGADTAADYCSRLHSELDSYASALFGALPSERARLRSVLDDLARTGRSLRQLATGAAEAVAQALLANLRPVLDAAVPASRAAAGGGGGGGGALGGGSEDGEDGEEDGEEWVPRLAAALSGLLVPARASLVPGAYEAVVASLLEGVASRLEAAVLSKRTSGAAGGAVGGAGRASAAASAGGGRGFTQLGGLQLERDVRALVAACAPLSSRTVRDKFARLSQMATALSVESVAEFAEYYCGGGGEGGGVAAGGGGSGAAGAGGGGAGAGGIAWRLAPSEVRAVLALRPDFTRESIEALPL
jgi:hypothetical protein